MSLYGIRGGRTIDVEVPSGWAICCDCGDMWLLTGPGHYCVRWFMDFMRARDDRSA